MSILIDILMKPLHEHNKMVQILSESVLYLIAGIIATKVMLLVITQSIDNREFDIGFYFWGSLASFLYYLSLFVIKKVYERVGNKDTKIDIS